MEILFEKEVCPSSHLTYTKDLFKALVQVLHHDRKVNLDKISEMTQLDKKEVLGLLEGYLFQDPTSFDEHHERYEDWLLKEEYLTGNILKKLKKATVLNQKYGGYFQKNVDCLSKMISPISYQCVVEAFPLLKNEFESYIKERALKNKRFNQSKYHSIAMRIVSGNWEESINHSPDISQMIQPEMNLWVEYLKRNNFLEDYGGYMMWMKEKDPFYQLLLNEKNLIVQSDIQQRMYTMLLGAALMIDYQLASEVTIVVGNTLKKYLIHLKNEIYPALPIKIITSRQLSKSESCVFVDHSAQIKTKVIKQLNPKAKVAFFLSCLDADLLKRIYEFIYFRLYSNSSILSDSYKNGYISTSQKYHNLSVYTCHLDNKWELIQLLAPILTIVSSDYSKSLRVDYSLHQYKHEEELLCEQYLEGQHLSMAKLISERIKFAQLSKIDTVLLTSFFSSGPQLIYIDQSEMMELMKTGLQSFGVSEDEIQIIKQTVKLKKAKYYIAKPKSVYPFQIPKLSTIHHLEALKDLSSFYDHLSDHLHIVYLTSDSIDSFYLQQLYLQEKFFCVIKEDETMMNLFYDYFKNSHSSETLKNQDQARFEQLATLRKQYISYTQNKTNLEPLYYDYMKLKKRKQLNREIDSYMGQTYFNRKEIALFTLGNYQVFLPRDLLMTHPYLLLKSPSNQEMIYPLKVGDNHIEKIIDLLRKETSYE